MVDHGKGEIIGHHLTAMFKANWEIYSEKTEAFYINHNLSSSVLHGKFSAAHLNLAAMGCQDQGKDQAACHVARTFGPPRTFDARAKGLLKGSIFKASHVRESRNLLSLEGSLHQKSAISQHSGCSLARSVRVELSPNARGKIIPSVTLKPKSR